MSLLRQPHPEALSEDRLEWTALRRGSLLSYLVGLYLICFYLEFHLRHPILQSIRFQFLFGAIIGIICAFKYVSTINRDPGTSVAKWAFVLIFWFGIYVLFSYDRPTSIIVYNDRVIKFALVAFFIYCAVDKIEDLRVIVFSLFLVWLKLGQEAIVGWTSGNLVWENQGIPRLHGSTTMFRHPNSLSGLAVTFLPFCLFYFYTFKSQIIRAGIIFLALAALLMILTSGSRTGYVALVLAFIALFLSLKKYKLRLFFIGVLFSSLAIYFAPIEYQERFESIFTGQEREGSSSQRRLEIIDDAVEIVKAYPLGVGVGAFPAVREAMFARTQDTHNLYLEVLTNTGFIGLLIFIGFIFAFFRVNIANFKRNTQSNLSPNDQKFLEATILFCMGYILVRLFLGMFGMDMYEIYWWLALGLTLACHKLTYQHLLEHKPDPRLRWRTG